MRHHVFARSTRMEISMDEWDVYQHARERAEGKLAFYFQLAVFAVANVVLILQRDSLSHVFPTMFWMLLAWGGALLFHGVVLFAFRGNTIITSGMIERELRLTKAEREKLRFEKQADQPTDMD